MHLGVFQSEVTEFNVMTTQDSLREDLQDTITMSAIFEVSESDTVNLDVHFLCLKKYMHCRGEGDDP